jgi:hypothetical protein
MNRHSFVENISYNENFLMIELGCEKEYLFDFIHEMIKRKIVLEVNSEYKFKFVGLIIYRNNLMCIYPKYFSDKLCSIHDQNRVIKLLKEYASRESIQVEEKEFLGYDDRFNENIIGIIDFILTDYYENGLYVNEEKLYEVNGYGQIDWNKTIERNEVIFDDNEDPIYVELVTSKFNFNENLIITNIHKYIVNQCFQQLVQLGLLDIFGYEDLSFELDDFYFEDDFIINHLNKELNSQYQDRKIRIIKAMINYITHRGVSGEEYNVSIYGTRYFNIVWEKINSYIFKNQYERYKQDIPKPNWSGILAKEGITKDTLIPDILLYLNAIKTFLILDAKYYSCIFDNDGKLKGNPPGIEDIVKQLAYESVFMDKFPNVFNAFIIPTLEKSKLTGSVSFKLFNTSGVIYTIHVNADEVIDMYIGYQKYSEKFLISLIPVKYKVSTINTIYKVADSDEGINY